MPVRVSDKTLKQEAKKIRKDMWKTSDPLNKRYNEAQKLNNSIKNPRRRELEKAKTTLTHVGSSIKHTVKSMAGKPSKKTEMVFKCGGKLKTKRK